MAVSAYRPPSVSPMTVNAGKRLKQLMVVLLTQKQFQPEYVCHVPLLF